MAEGVTSIGRYQGVELLGGSATRDVEVEQWQTDASGVYFEFRIPRADWTPTQAAQEASQYANYIENVAQRSDVGGLFYNQTVNAAGQLVDVFDITVLSASGLSSAQIEVPFGLITSPTLGERIDALSNQLTAAETI